MSKKDRVIELIRERREIRRFFGRRSIDKSHGEVIEVLDFDGDSQRVVETTPEKNFEGEQTACARAEELYDEWTAVQILKAIIPKNPKLKDPDV
jgi:hypothetical protein